VTTNDGKAGSRKKSGTMKAVVAAESVADLRRRFKRAEAPPDAQDKRYLLRLYVTGMTPASRRAIERARALCEQHLKGRYELEVIDIYQLPALAKDQQIIATPTLIKVLPTPLRRYIGDLSREEKVLFGLELCERQP
jgi:circadian clock protein KaiB